jgi:uncharacterized protein YdeI (BOF family)
MLKKILIVVIGLLLLSAIAGCGATAKIEQSVAPSPVNIQAAATTTEAQPGDRVATEPAPSPGIITVAELNKNSAALIGKEVIMEGKIVQECGAGCWFNLQDSTGIVYVDLAPNNIVIPQKVGSKAKVYGKVDKRSGVTYIIGSKVEF